MRTELYPKGCTKIVTRVPWQFTLWLFPEISKRSLILQSRLQKMKNCCYLRFYDNAKVRSTFIFITIMAELSFKLAKHIENFQASISYKGNHIILKFLTDKSSIDTEVSRIISEKYMSGDLLKDFSLRKCKITHLCFLESLLLTV